MDSSFYHISEKAVEHVAERAILTVPGVRQLDAQLAGLAGRKYPRVDVHLDRASAIAAVEAEIATTYPSPVAAITDAVRATIISHVRTLCGLDVSRVQIHVANVEADTTGHRVTWDDVASHNAGVEPVGIRVSPSEVHSPVTKERIALAPVEVDSSVDHMREVTLPAPPTVQSVDVPAAPEVQTSGFVGPAAKLVDVVVPPPVQPRVPSTPEAHELAPVERFVPTAVSVTAPDPRPVQHPQPPQRRQLAPVHAFVPRVDPVSLPPRRPLKEVLVNRARAIPVSAPAAPHMRPVSAPVPHPVVHPVAPRPQPLKQITIRPVEKYYDRTR